MTWHLYATAYQIFVLLAGAVCGALFMLAFLKLSWAALGFLLLALSLASAWTLT